jgi:hypothetical protein
MEDSKATHPPAPFLPTEVKVGDWVFLNGDNVDVYSGLYGFQFTGQGEEAPGYRYALRRDSENQVYFQVSAAQVGTFEVSGRYADKSPIDDEKRSFGTMRISPQD